MRSALQENSLDDKSYVAGSGQAALLAGSDSSKKQDLPETNKSPDPSKDFNAEEWSKYLMNKWGSMIPQYVGERSECRSMIQGPSPDQLLSNQQENSRSNQNNLKKKIE